MNLAGIELRMVFHAKEIMRQVCQRVAETNIIHGPNSDLHVVDWTLDDDPDYPTVIIEVEEVFMYECEQHTLVLPFEDFVDLYQHVSQKLSP